jgi:hypothetical protein
MIMAADLLVNTTLQCIDLSETRSNTLSLVKTSFKGLTYRWAVFEALSAKPSLPFA